MEPPDLQGHESVGNSTIPAGMHKSELGKSSPRNSYWLDLQRSIWTHLISVTLLSFPIILGDGWDFVGAPESYLIGIKSGWVICKASALPFILSLQPPHIFLFCFVLKHTQ